MPTHRCLAISLGLATAVAAAGVVAAPKGKAVVEPPVVQRLLDCRKVSGDADRLACYDKATADMESATASGDLVSIDRAQRRAARRQAFGFALPTLSFLERGEKTGELSNVTATVKAAYRGAEGEWVVELDDGATWRQTEAQELGRPPRAGSKVEISKGMLGSFFMTIDGQGAGRAKRIG